MDVSPNGGGAVNVEETYPSSYPFASNFKNGASIRLEAIPAPGYQFNNWGGDLSGTANPTTILIDCNKKITANFSKIMHTLTIQVSGSGSTNPTVGTYNYSEGVVLDVSATPDSGWQFDSWTGDVADPSLATTTVIMDSDKTVAVRFSQDKTTWWLIGGVITGVIIIGVIIWLGIRTRAA